MRCELDVNDCLPVVLEYEDRGGTKGLAVFHVPKQCQLKVRVPVAYCSMALKVDGSILDGGDHDFRGLIHVFEVDHPRVNGGDWPDDQHEWTMLRHLEQSAARYGYGLVRLDPKGAPVADCLDPNLLKHDT